MGTVPGGRLIVTCGLAGAGKTTVAKEIEAAGAVRLCPDEWLVDLGFDLFDPGARNRIEARLWELGQELLLLGLTVVDECGTWKRAERDVRREWAREHGVAVELRFLDAPIPELIARVAARNEVVPERERIPPNLVAYWDAQMERPDAVELALFDPPLSERPSRQRRSRRGPSPRSRAR